MLKRILKSLSPIFHTSFLSPVKPGILKRTLIIIVMTVVFTRVGGRKVRSNDNERKTDGNKVGKWNERPNKLFSFGKAESFGNFFSSDPLTN